MNFVNNNNNNNNKFEAILKYYIKIKIVYKLTKIRDFFIEPPAFCYHVFHLIVPTLNFLSPLHGYILIVNYFKKCFKELCKFHLLRCVTQYIITMDPFP